jgi:hypothetical protein
VLRHLLSEETKAVTEETYLMFDLEFGSGSLLLPVGRPPPRREMAAAERPAAAVAGGSGSPRQPVVCVVTPLHACMHGWF